MKMLIGYMHVHVLHVLYYMSVCVACTVYTLCTASSLRYNWLIVFPNSNYLFPFEVSQTPFLNTNGIDFCFI